MYIFVFKFVQFSHMMIGLASLQTFSFMFLTYENAPLLVKITVGHGGKEKVNYCILLQNVDL